MTQESVTTSNVSRLCICVLHLSTIFLKLCKSLEFFSGGILNKLSKCVFMRRSFRPNYSFKSFITLLQFSPEIAKPSVVFTDIEPKCALRYLIYFIKRYIIVNRDPQPKNFLKLRLQLHSCLISYGSGSAPAPDMLRQFYFPGWDFNLQFNKSSLTFSSVKFKIKNLLPPHLF